MAQLYAVGCDFPVGVYGLVLPKTPPYFYRCVRIHGAEAWSNTIILRVKP